MSPAERKVHVVSPATFQEIRKERVQSTFKLDPQVEIVLKGKTYTLEFNNWAAKELTKAIGFNPLREPLSMGILSDPAQLGAVLLYGLLTNHPDLDQDQVDRLFTFRHIEYVISRLTLSLQMIMPDMSDYEIVPEDKESEQDPT